MEEEGIEAACPEGRGGGAVTGELADVAGPLAAAGKILKHGEFDAGRGGKGAGAGAIEELFDLFHPLAGGGADESDGAA